MTTQNGGLPPLMPPPLRCEAAMSRRSHQPPPECLAVLESDKRQGGSFIAAECGSCRVRSGRPEHGGPVESLPQRQRAGLAFLFQHLCKQPRGVRRQHGWPFLLGCSSSPKREK